MTCRPRSIRQSQGHPGPRHHIPGSILVDFLLLFISSPDEIKPMLDIPLCKQPSRKVCCFSTLSNRAVYPPDMEPDHFSPEQDIAEVYRTRNSSEVHRTAVQSSWWLQSLFTPECPGFVVTAAPHLFATYHNWLIDEKQNARHSLAITVFPWTGQHTSSQGFHPGKDPRT